MKFSLSKFEIKNRPDGFTTVELLIIVVIIIILTGISATTFRFFGAQSALNNSTEEIINTLKIAQSKTLASEGASQWGVYFSASTDPNQYTLFKGSSYAARTTSSDESHELPKTVEIYEIDLWSGNEVVFERITGFASSTAVSGKISLRLKNDASSTRIIYINHSGQVGLQ